MITWHVKNSHAYIGEGMCYDECCEMCKPDDSQTCTPGDKNTLYVY